MVNIRSVVTLNRIKEQSLSWNCEFILVEQKYFQEQLVFSCMRVRLRVRGSLRPKQADAFMGLVAVYYRACGTCSVCVCVVRGKTIFPF